MKVRSGQRYFRGAKGDYEKRRSWARQSSGAILYRLANAGDSDYGFCLKATFWILEEQLKKNAGQQPQSKVCSEGNTL